MSDYICCLYGEPGAYGVVTKIASVRNGINNFLAGYIPAENMRFRAEELSFVVSGAETADQIASEGGMGKSTLGTVEYPAMSKTLEKAESRFTLHVEPGSFRGAEMIGLLGENGCGKTTFMEMMAGAFDKKADGSADKSVENHSLAGLGVSYKRQHYAPRLRKFPGTVQELFEKTIQNVIVDRLFRLLVLRPLQMEALEKSYVKNLSGGELQRVAITICLGTPATIYLFDEPSAGLDCEQRIIAAKVIRRWVVSNMQKTAFIIEHDFVMASALSDRVIVYDGKPGIECTAKSPMGLVDGFNVFLKQLDVTFRRDPCNFRPRVNKKNSAKDCEQKKSGNYFVFDADEDPVDEADKEKPAPKKKGQSKKG
jgi:ATP-binding cassette subfamily E protein 1